MTAARIAFCGNVANALFPIVRVLRDQGVDAHLFVDSREPARWRPETDDPTLADGYPPWIHDGEWIRKMDMVIPGRAPIIAELEGFDLVVGSGNTPMLAPFLRAPFIFFTTGADLTKQPFPIAFRGTRNGLLDMVGHAFLALWQRRGIRAAAQIWTQPFAPFLDALGRLNVPIDRVTDAYFPLIVDTDLFTPNPTSSPDWAAELRKNSDFVVLHPSRLVLDESPLMLRSGQTKGSRSILEGFARFVATGSAERPVIVLPSADRGAPDATKAIAELGIEDHVVWAEAPRPSGFHRTEMVHLYAAADVTVNEIGAGWFGWAALESMACGVPVVSHIDHDGIRQLYGEDWEWIHAQDANDLTERLRELAADSDERQARGRASREWIMRHHSVETAGRRMHQSVIDVSTELLASSPSPAPQHSR